MGSRKGPWPLCYWLPVLHHPDESEWRSVVHAKCDIAGKTSVHGIAGAATTIVSPEDTSAQVMIAGYWQS